MSDFLLELRSEEIPARMQAGARAALEKLFTEQLAAAGLKAGALTIWSTPRRLTLIARDLPAATEAVSEERKGPRADAPEQALAGFLRSTGLTRDQLEERTDAKGVVTLFAVTQKPGRATADVLAEAIPAIIRAFPWPKSQRWGTASQTTESLRWVRPLSAIIALLDGEIVPLEIDGIVSGRETMGHRFHSSGAISIANADDYATKLRDAYVIVDHEERAAMIRKGAAEAASAAGLVLVEDEGLVVENAGLSEWPVPLLGRFDEAFLEVPPEVIQLTARVNQKYFICRDAAGNLANAFVCTANIAPRDGGAGVVAGNQKVLAARLSDARFFWEQDQKKSLKQHAEKLSNIVFHEKLGTVAFKVARVAKLARWLVEEGIVKTSPERGGGPAKLVEGQAHDGLTSPASNVAPAPLHHPADGPPPRSGEVLALANLAQQAAELCKADLVTEMVGEFPELQGLMGGYYAAKEGLDLQVAAAIRDHYKPVGQGDDVPTAPVTVAVSLADKLDTLFGFFVTGQTSTGSKDPFALRRAALGVIRILQKHGVRLPIQRWILEAYSTFLSNESHRWFLYLVDLEGIVSFRAVERSMLNTFPMKEYWSFDTSSTDEWFQVPYSTQELKTYSVAKFYSLHETERSLLDFFADRLKVQQREAGVRHDLIDAVFALGGEDDLVRLLARVKALQSFVATPDGTNLLAGYKRAANILKQAGPDSPLPFRGGAGGGVVPDSAGSVDKPHPNPSPEGEGLHGVPAPEGEGLDSLALLNALNAAEPLAAAAVAEERFEDAMTALASLRAPIDAFFDGVMVNDPDPAIRAFRLSLLARFRDAVHSVADFSKIEG